MSENENNQQEPGNNIEQELEGIAREDETEAQTEQAVQGELITRQEASEDQQRYEKALQKTLPLMAGVRYGMGLAAPYVSFGEREPEFIEHGASKLAHILKKYDDGDENGRLAQLLIRWKEEIDAAVFFSAFGVDTWLQIQAHKAAMAEAEKNQQQETDAPALPSEVA